MNCKKLKGSALMWAICVLAVSLILIGGVLGIAGIYHKRTITDTQKQQALYTSVSALSLISEDIQQDTEKKWFSMLWDDALNKPVQKTFLIENLSFENNDMGNINLKFEWSTDEAEKFPYTMKVTAETSYYETYEEISAEFEFTEEKKWTLIKYCE